MKKKNSAAEKERDVNAEDCCCNGEHCECGCDEQHICEDEHCTCNSEKINTYDEISRLASEYLSLAQQTQADFDNYRKRNLDAVKQAKDEGRASVIVQILPCADVIDKAIEMTKDDATLSGLKMVANRFQEVLSGLGVSKYESKGQLFDVNYHNAITSIESPEPSGTIIEEYESGYCMGDKVIRFAQVVISK